MLAAAHRPTSPAGGAAKLLELPSELVTLDADSLFAPPAALVDADLAEWVTFAQARDADFDDGLALVGAPLDDTLSEVT
jgi:hypothetical protein